MNIRSKIMKTGYIFLFLTLALPMALYSQGDNIRFRRLSIEHGLSQSSAFCIVQDNKGFIWIGTEAGLNRYDGYKFKIYTYDEKNPNTISNEFILSMCKDRSGVLWVGTESGFNRFDASKEQFTRYLNDPDKPHSISNSRVTSICEGRHGFLWVGTECGLNKFNKEKNRFTRYYTYPDNPNSLSHNIIRAVYEDKSGTLWIGTYGGGLNEYDRKKDRFFCYKNIPDDPFSLSDDRVLSIYEDRSGMLWVGTEGGGLNKYDRENEVFIHYKYEPDDPNSLSESYVNCIYEDEFGTLWIGTNDGGLNIFDRGKLKFISFKHDPDKLKSLSINRIEAIYEDNDEGLWFGTRGGGINLFNRATQRFIHYKSLTNNPNSLSYNAVRPIYEDTSGILWIGTDGGGLNKFDREKGIYTHYKHDPNNQKSISGNSVFAICEDRLGVFWVGIHGGGLNKLNKKWGIFTHYRHDPDNAQSLGDDRIRAMLVDRSGVLWIGTNGGGLDRFDREKKVFTHYKNDPNDPHSLSNDRIFCIYEDRAGYLWIGTFGGGLNKFDRGRKRFTHYKTDTSDINSISKNFIISLYEDRERIMWIGTVHGGLNKFDRSKGIFTRYTTKDGLPDDLIYDIIPDNRGYLWMSTNRGLSRFDPKIEEFKNFDVKDGLQSNEFNTGTGFISSRTGEMFFGGINGFNSFFPDSIMDNPFVPPIAITSFQLFNKPVLVGKLTDGRTILEKSITATKEITLSYTDNVFSFEFAALHYVSPERNRYAYKMIGLEKEWNYVGNRRFVTYTGLPPGEYTFRVMGSNNDGAWNEKGTSLKITIIPPFWNTWWFYILCIISGVLIIIAIFAYQMNRLKKQKEEEERRRVTGIFSQVLEQGNAAVYRRNFDVENYEYMGEGIKDITGYDPGDFTRSFWFKIVMDIEMGGDLKGLSMGDVFQQVRYGKLDRWVADLKITSKSGEIKWVRDMTTALRDEDGVCHAIFGIVFDITDRKLAEQELARTSGELRKKSEDLRIRSEELTMKNKEMEKDLDMAREVQMALLSQNYPKNFPENVPAGESALEFSHRYIPASTLAGDFFEVFPVSDHEVGIMIYDVMGHGVRASLLTAYLHGLIEEIMPTAGDPVVFVKRLNVGLTAVMEQFFAGMFATAFYLVADIKTGTMRYTNAGHPTPYIIRRNGDAVTKLPTEKRHSEPALGLFKDFKYSATESSMKDDDIVFFFTDGIYEVEGLDRELFGEERLIKTVKRLMHDTPEKMLDAILNDIQKFAGSDDFNDDVCIIMMHVKRALAKFTS